MSLFSELKRRNVFRVGTAYIVAAWLVIQVVETILPAFGFDSSAVRIVVIVLAVLFVPVLVFSWAFELTPEGLKRDHEVDRRLSITPQTGKRLDRLIMVVLALALGYFAFDKFVLDPARDVDIAEAARHEGRSEALVESHGDKSIAVLPFVNMSSDPEQEFFSDGIAEEVLNLLARIPELRVISRSSAFSFRDKDIEIPDVARRLNVAHILEGSVRKAGNRVRITAQLIEARSDTHLWSETYDRTLEDIFATQDEIAAAVVEQLEVTLVGEAPTSTTIDPDAYTLFLHARHIRQTQRTVQAYLKAEELLREALEIEPEYLDARLELALVYIDWGDDGVRSKQEIQSLRQDAYDAVERLDPDNTFVALRNAQKLFDARKYQEYATRLAEIYNSDPTEAALEAKVFLELLGRYDEAAATQNVWLTHDPGNCAPYLNLTVLWWIAGDHHKVIEWGEKAANLCPGNTSQILKIGLSLAFLGRFDEALKIISKLQTDRHRLYGLVVVHHLAGSQGQSDQHLEILKSSGGGGTAPEFWLASAYSFRGEIDTAFEWLDKFGPYVFWWNDPWFRGLAHDPRWETLTEKKGISQKDVEGIEFEITVPD